MNKTNEPAEVTVTISSEIMRGLDLLRRHLEEDGHNWTGNTNMADVEAACEWISAINARAKGGR